MADERGDPYTAYLVAADGTRTPVAAYGVVVELAPGREVELDLAPHPAFAGGLLVTAGPGPKPDEPVAGGVARSLVVRPGASNVVLLSVECRVRATGPDGE